MDRPACAPPLECLLCACAGRQARQLGFYRPSAKVLVDGFSSPEGASP